MPQTHIRPFILEPLSVFIILVFFVIKYLNNVHNKMRPFNQIPLLLDTAKNELENKAVYNKIHNFAMQYEADSESTNLEQDNSKFIQLEKYLKRKEVRLDSEQTKEIVEYFIFKNRILSNSKNKDLDSFIQSFIQTYYDEFGTFYDESLDSINIDNKLFVYFIYLIKESKDNSISLNKLSERIISSYKVIENEKFEKHLDDERKIIKMDNKQYISFEDLKRMDGYEFEAFLTELFKKMGYDAIQTKLSNDQGADIIIRNKLGIKIAVQAKQWEDKVSNGAIQEVAAAVKYYGADKGMVVTTSSFTSSAVRLAAANNIELISKEKLLGWIDEYR